MEVINAIGRRKSSVARVYLFNRVFPFSYPAVRG